MCITTKVPFPKLVKSFLFFCTKTRALSAFTLMSSSYNSAWHREGQYTHTHTGTYPHTPGHTQTQTHTRGHIHIQRTHNQLAGYTHSRIHTYTQKCIK